MLNTTMTTCVERRKQRFTQRGLIFPYLLLGDDDDLLRGWWCRKTGREVSYSPGFCKHKTHHVLGNMARNDVKSFPLFFQRTRKKRQPNFIFHLLSLVLLFCLLLCCVVVVLGKFVSPLCMISKDLRYI